MDWVGGCGVTMWLKWHAGGKDRLFPSPSCEPAITHTLAFLSPTEYTYIPQMIGPSSIVYPGLLRIVMLSLKTTTSQNYSFTESSACTEWKGWRSYRENTCQIPCHLHQRHNSHSGHLPKPHHFGKGILSNPCCRLPLSLVRASLINSTFKRRHHCTSLIPCWPSLHSANSAEIRMSYG